MLLDLVVKFRVGRAERKSEGRRGRFRFVQHKIPFVSWFNAFFWFGLFALVPKGERTCMGPISLSEDVNPYYCFGVCFINEISF